MILGVTASSISKTGYDSDYSAYITRLNDLSITLPSVGQQVLQNQLVLDIKSGGVWDKADFIALFATDGGINAAKIALKSTNNYSLYTTGVENFTSSEGFRGDALEARIIASYNPTTDGINYTLNDASVFVYCPEGVSVDKQLFGILGTAGISYADSFHLGTATRCNNQYDISTTSYGGTFYGLMQLESNQCIKVVNNTHTSVSNTPTNIPNKDFSFLGRNGSSSTMPSHLVSFGFIGGSLSQSESDLLKTALDNYYTSL